MSDTNTLMAIKEMVEGLQPSREIMTHAFEEILKGEIEPEIISSFLVALRMKGETISDIEAGARVMRAHSKKVSTPEDVVDTCGTGGLPFVSLNTSTAAAIVVAAAGGRVAKHGNRSTPPKTGSADVLEALGVKIDVTDAQFNQCIEIARVGFMFARTHHAAMKHVAPIRQKLGMKTIFNLLGPLTNPASAKYQVIGVYHKKWVEPFAQVLSRLGVQKAWIVHGCDGLDEITITGKSTIAEIEGNSIHVFELDPTKYGLSLAPISSLKGGTPAENALAIEKIFNGEKTPFRDMVALNAGAALYVSKRAESFESGIQMSLNVMSDGSAKHTLELLVTYSNA